MLDGIFINKIKDEISFLIEGRISKITSSVETEYILTIRKDRKNYNLLISLSQTFSRIHLTNNEAKDNLMKNFLILLKKNIEGYLIKDISTYESDRIIYFKLYGNQEFEDPNYKYLFCEIMGRFSNLILTDENNKIIECLHHDGVGEYNRIMMPNSFYKFPNTAKINPFFKTLDEIKYIFVEKNIQNPNDLSNTFLGVSSFLAKEIFLDENPEESFYKAINSKPLPSIIKVGEKLDFYYIPLNSEIIETFDNFSQLFDKFYQEIELKTKINIRTNDLNIFVNKHIKKYENKIKKLDLDLKDTVNKDKYKLYGELLLSYPNLKEKHKEIVIFNYYDNKEILIPLDERYTIIDNSNRYYKKYQKLKNSVIHLEEQLQIAKDDLEYFKLIDEQLKIASIEDALEIKEELIKNKYLFEKDKKKNKKNERPSYLRYKIGDNYIYVGKNNLQNEYLTHKFAKKDWYWFHVKNTSSSHVIVSTNELNEELIRAAAMLASKHSTFKDSSSIPVDYTQIKNIKKIPGKRNCFVTYKNEKTIYIDIDNELLNKLKKA